MAMMNLDLSGKTALITASVSGIGLATAQGLCARGASVWINGRRPERINAAKKAIEERVPGARVMTMLADVAVPPPFAALPHCYRHDQHIIHA
jgi:NAD(P)-dependent dehydrogenase (short-subunit alcohol dehydrogenase family)